MPRKMVKQYKFVEPAVTTTKMIDVLVEGLGRPLSEQEIRTIYWLGESEYTTREVILDLFIELNKRIQ
ncbi:MAG: hypothetical protein ABS939_00665 [Psychrobacillus sp.]